MSIQLALCLVVFNIGTMTSELAQDAAENPPIIVTETERKASVARSESFKPDDIPPLLEKAASSVVPIWLEKVQLRI
jgi:hypothetical protein